MELAALWSGKEQLETRLAELPQIKIPHYPEPPKPTPEPDKPAGEFVVRGAHPELARRSDGSVEPDERGVAHPIRR